MNTSQSPWRVLRQGPMQLAGSCVFRAKGDQSKRHSITRGGIDEVWGFIRRPVIHHNDFCIRRPLLRLHCRPPAPAVHPHFDRDHHRNRCVGMLLFALATRTIARVNLVASHCCNPRTPEQCIHFSHSGKATRCLRWTNGQALRPSAEGFEIKWTDSTTTSLQASPRAS